LIELLVVIAIIGILAAVVLVSLNSARAKSRDAKRLSDIRQIQTALELFYNDNNSYPTATAGEPTPGDGTPDFDTLLSDWPTAPGPFDGTCDAVNNLYVYEGRDALDTATANISGLIPFYRVTFCLGAPTGGYAAGPLIARPSGIK